MSTDPAWLHKRRVGVGCLALVLVVVMAFAPSGIRAQQESPPGGSPPAEATTEPITPADDSPNESDTAPTPPAEPAPAQAGSQDADSTATENKEDAAASSTNADDELSEDDLIEQIDPNRRPPLAEARERLEQAIEKMRTAKDRLTQSDTGDDTRKLQTQAADDLQKILDLLQQPPPPSQSSSQNQNQQQQQQQQQRQQQNQQQRQNQSRSRSQQQRQQRQQKQSGSRRQRQQNRNRQLAQQQPQPQPGGERNENPQDSQDKLDPAQQKAAEEARRRAVANDVWGHLPPNVREALQKSFNERYLPKYEDLVRRYYESLAEKRRD